MEKSLEKKKRKIDPILVIGVLLFFILSSILPFWQRQQGFVKFFSPDENANYVFSKLYSENRELSIFEKYNLVAQDLIHPRSYVSWQGVMKPVSFLGIILIYGQMARFLGSGLIPFLSPLFASIALIFYYLIIKKVFNNIGIARKSFLFLASFPVFIFYTSRSLFHNILFISFFIIAVYFLIILLEKRPVKSGSFLLRNLKVEARLEYWKKLWGFDFLYSALVGIFIGLSIGVRASELVWIFPAGLLLLILRYRQLSFFRLGVMISFAFLALMPVFYYNQVLHGSLFFGGYYEMNQSIENLGQASGNIIKSVFSGSWQELGSYFESIFKTIFYFGFHPRQSWQMFLAYVPKMFYWLIIPAIGGGLYLFVKRRDFLKKNWSFIIAYLLLSLILVLYYGSWRFVDNPDPSRQTIGNSYTRYWLPIYLGIIPLAAVFCNYLTSFFKKRSIRVLSSLILSLSIIMPSLFFVYQGSEEGLKHYFPNLIEAREELKFITESTETSAVIITEYHDKFFFPERKVIVGRFDDNNMLNYYYQIAKYLPLYYYNFTLSSADLEYLNNRRLKEFGLNIDLKSEYNSVFSLYQLRVLDEGN